MPLRTLILVLLALAVLSGCGRRGNLEPPGGQPAAAAGPYGTPADVSPLDPGSVPATPEQHQIQPPPRRRYFLDFFL